MKHLFTLLLMAITFTGFAQISPPSTPKAGTKQATTNQAYIYRSLTGDTTRLYLRLGASGITADYYEIGSGGSGSITSVTSANSDISVANPTTAPVLTLNSGYGVGQVAKFSVAPSSGIRLGWDAGLNNSIYTTPSNRYFYYDAGAASFGGHVFLVNSGQTALSIGSTRYITMPILSSGGTAPSPIGTSKMVTTDANGTLSFADIPSSGISSASNGLTKTGSDVALGGLLTNNTAIDLDSSTGISIGANADNSGGFVLTNSGAGSVNAAFGISYASGVIKSGLQIGTDAMSVTDSVNYKGLQYSDNYRSNFSDNSLVDKRYVDSIAGGGIKDFYTDSTVSNNTGSPKILYADTLKANQLSKNGDVVKMKVSGFMNVLVVADQYLHVNYDGTNLIPFTITPTAIGNVAWEMNITVMRAPSTTTYISAVLTTSSSSSPASSKLGTVVGTSFTSPRQLALTASQSSGSVGSLVAKMGYIEFKPASL